MLFFITWVCGAVGLPFWEFEHPALPLDPRLLHDALPVGVPDLGSALHAQLVQPRVGQKLQWVSIGKKELVWPLFGCCTSDSQTDAWRHQLNNNGSSLFFFPLLGNEWRRRLVIVKYLPGLYKEVHKLQMHGHEIPFVTQEFMSFSIVHTTQSDLTGFYFLDGIICNAVWV